ncbi:MAG TPA: phosphoribosyl-AMP cyclohydrolase [bacterium]|nr:phosphoribosyl-AMP cyclohydrolase [bacterium]
MRYNADGLIPAIVQDYSTKKILMMAYMNEEAFRKTCETGKATFYSRSREKIWVKGEESGNIQVVKEIRTDCDEDTLLILVEARGPACHEGYESCFFRTYEKGNWKITEKRLFDPKEVYRK